MIIGTDKMREPVGFCPFFAIKPTWEIIPFDEGLSEIPCVSRSYYGRNPLDKDVAIEYFDKVCHEHAYFLPRTGEIRITGRAMYDEADYSKLFGLRVCNAYKISGKDNCRIRPFCHTEIIEDSLVYRRFEITVSCRKTGDTDYDFQITPAIETCRYVFNRFGVIMENRDKTRTITTAAGIPTDGVYDTLIDAIEADKMSLYQAFARDVEILHKEDIMKALPHVKKDSPRLGINPFIDIYSRAAENIGLSESVPVRIVQELNLRKHTANSAVRIAKDLVVITGERKCRYLDYKEETRAYFDMNSAYYFRRNAVTGKWQSDDLAKRVSNNREIEERIIDSDFLENTCAEQFARYSIENRIPRGQKVNLGVLLAQVGFLSAEQAAKIQSPIFEKILQNIFEGKLCDGDKSLAELLGISGAQIKFLEEIEIPDDLAAFSECMEAEDFKVHFPDVKKRIFAAVFYCNGRSNSWDHSRELKKEEIFAAAKTLSSLEKTRIEDRDRLLTEYRDYIIMRRAYQNYKDHMRDDDPLREEILAYGDVPINIKPSKIRDCHNKLGRIIEVFHCSDQILKYSRAIEERYEKEAKQREYADGRYSIIMPKDAFDIIREGRELQHCVGRAGYIGSMAAGRCTILFLRSCDNPNTPLITIEERDKMIRQCYGFLNSYNKDAEIRDFIKTYADLQGLTIGTVIYEDDIRGGV